MEAHLELAKTFFDIIPSVMQHVRVEVRAAVGNRLTIPQYRILRNLHKGMKGVNEIADHQGVSPAAMSKMIDALVQKGLVQRSASAADRRQTKLELTTKGSALFLEVRGLAQVRLSQKLKALPPAEQQKLEAALTQIEEVFLHAPGKL